MPAGRARVFRELRKLRSARNLRPDWAPAVFPAWPHSLRTAGEAVRSNPTRATRIPSCHSQWIVSRPTAAINDPSGLLGVLLYRSRSAGRTESSGFQRGDIPLRGLSRETFCKLLHLRPFAESAGTSDLSVQQCFCRLRERHFNCSYTLEVSGLVPLKAGFRSHPGEAGNGL